MPIYDPVSQLISLDDLAPVDDAVNLPVISGLYSDAKAQWLSDDDLNKFEFPWLAEGGSSLPTGGVTPRFYFLKPDWRIKPHEADHALNLQGNIFRQDGAKLTAPTTGEFTVEVNVITDIGPQGLLESILLGSVTLAQAIKEIYQRLGLDAASPMTATPNSISVDGINIIISGDGVNTSTMTRQ